MTSTSLLPTAILVTDVAKRRRDWCAAASAFCVIVRVSRALPFFGPAPERNDKLFSGERLEQTKPHERMLDALFIFATRPCAIA